MTMDSVATKLARCFSLAFPELPQESIPTATAESVERWDSMAQITLLSLVGEEFGIEIDFEEFEGADSFKALAERLRQRGLDA